MSDVTFVGKNIASFRSAPRLAGYSRVVLVVSDELEYTSGTDTGRTLTMECPWGTQAMANKILARVRGFQYQPYTATGARLDPAAELGDGITANNTYSGIYSQNIKFGPGYSATVSAPNEEDIDHEYPYKPKQDRRFVRTKAELRAQIVLETDKIMLEVSKQQGSLKELTSTVTQQAGEIEAKVNKTGGNASSFGWVLDSDSWTIKANGAAVLEATKNGLSVTGKITATSGQIGGFTIGSNALTYNKHTWGGTNTNGIYIGLSGIQLGKNFKVDTAGNLTAASGTFSGTVKAGKIAYGENDGYFSGAGIKAKSISGGEYGQIKAASLNTENMASGIKTSLGYANFSNDVFSGIEKSDWLITKRLTLGEYKCGWSTISYVDHDGNTRSLRVMSGQ